MATKPNKHQQQQQQQQRRRRNQQRQQHPSTTTTAALTLSQEQLVPVRHRQVRVPRFQTQLGKHLSADRNRSDQLPVCRCPRKWLFLSVLDQFVCLLPMKVAVTGDCSFCCCSCWCNLRICGSCQCPDNFLCIFPASLRSRRVQFANCQCKCRLAAAASC